MNNLKNLYEIMQHFGEQNLTPEQESLVLLTSIAQSLAVIADRLTEGKKGESEVKE